jgi:type VI secretion system protein ImpJ
MDDKLARVRWEMGQTLLPEHLLAQEESILADTVLRFRMQGLPSYGIGKLKLNETLLNEGIFSIQEMTMVMGSGLLLDFPGNAKVSPFNLNIPGMVSVSVYLHVLKDIPAVDDTREGWEENAEVRISRIVYRLALSSEQSYSGAMETLRLAEFKKNLEGVWQISRDFIPPLLQLGASPFLKKDMDELSEVLELFQYNLSLDAASYLSGESLVSVKQCLKSVFKTQRLLANLGSQIHLHPYFLYEELKTLFTEVCLYRNATPQDIAAPYDHDQLASLKDMISLLNKQMQIVRSRPPYLPFKLSDNIYQVKLPDEIRKATDVYFLVQKSQVMVSLSIDALKVAGQARLPFVYKMALQGIPLKKVVRPPFQHSFGAEVEFYLIREGEEWDHALNEMTLAFYDRPDLKDTDFYIYWRMG